MTNLSGILDQLAVIEPTQSPHEGVQLATPGTSTAFTNSFFGHPIITKDLMPSTSPDHRSPNYYLCFFKDRMYLEDNFREINNIEDQHTS